MSKKRCDTKGRILHTGESQEKDGRYVYKYVDTMGKRRTIRSWRLTKNDPMPSSRQRCEPLREIEKQIQADMTKGLCNTEMTVLELVDIYLKTLTGVRHNTSANHKTMRNLLASEAFGYYKIKRVKTTDAKLFFIKLQKEDKKGYSTIHSLRGVLRPAFRMAVEDEILLKNPFDFYLATVIVNDSVTREAVTPEEERRFLTFIKEDNHYQKYYDAVLILFKTGMRISEFCGLTISDIDLQNNTVNINHQLQRTRDMQYVIESTKTNAGTRIIPISNEVRDAFKRIIQNRPAPKAEPMFGGYAGFLFLDKNEKPKVALHWEHYFKQIRNKYNRIYKIQIPNITPHVCRHTYCSNMARSGMNPKTLQYLMGHSDISITMNTYTHLGLNDARNELERLEAVTKEVREVAWKNRKRTKIV